MASILTLLDSALSRNGGAVDGNIVYKGIINIPADFPTIAEVKVGWEYTIGTDVTDNDPAKTNTGQSFIVGDEVRWAGTNWAVVGQERLWIELLGYLQPFNDTSVKVLGDKNYYIGNNPVSFISEKEIFVRANGINTNSGLNDILAVQTIAEGINKATALTPAVDNQIIIRITDASQYNETFILPAFVHIYAPNASLGSGIQDVSLNNYSSIFFKKIVLNNLNKIGIGTARFECESIALLGQINNTVDNTNKLFGKVGVGFDGDVNTQNSAYTHITTASRTGGTDVTDATSTLIFVILNEFLDHQNIETTKIQAHAANGCCVVDGLQINFDATSIQAAVGTCQCVNASIVNGNTVTFENHNIIPKAVITLTVGTDFAKGATSTDTAVNLAAAINAKLVLNNWIGAVPNGDYVQMQAVTLGFYGNKIALLTNNPAGFILPVPALLYGGYTRIDITNGTRPYNIVQFSNATANPTNPTSERYTLNNIYGLNLTYRTLAPVTYLVYKLIAGVPTLTQQPTFPTREQFLNEIYFGAILHINLNELQLFVHSNSGIPRNIANTLRNSSGLVAGWAPAGNIMPFATGTRKLYIKQSAYIAPEINRTDINDPNYLVLPEIPLFTDHVIVTYRNGTGGFTISTRIDLNGISFDATRYDDGTGGGTGVNALPNGLLTANLPYGTRRIYREPLTGKIKLYMQYGQNIYATQQDALNALPTETFLLNPNLDVGWEYGVIIIQRNATDFTNPAQFIFLPKKAYGSSSAGAGYQEPTQQQVIYFKTGGNISGDGRNIETAVDSHRTAENKVGTLSPSFDLRYSVVCADAGPFAGATAITYQPYTTIDATQTIIKENDIVTFGSSTTLYGDLITVKCAEFSAFALSIPQNQSQSITSLTRSGSIVTVAKIAHGYKAGQKIKIAGANEAEYNIKADIITAVTDSFQYRITGTPTTPATGTITARLIKRCEIEADKIVLADVSLTDNFELTLKSKFIDITAIASAVSNSIGEINIKTEILKNIDITNATDKRLFFNISANEISDKFNANYTNITLVTNNIKYAESVFYISNSNLKALIFNQDRNITIGANVTGTMVNYYKQPTRTITNNSAITCNVVKFNEDGAMQIGSNLNSYAQFNNAAGNPFVTIDGSIVRVTFANGQLVGIQDFEASRGVIDTIEKGGRNKIVLTTSDTNYTANDNGSEVILAHTVSADRSISLPSETVPPSFNSTLFNYSTTYELHVLANGNTIISNGTTIPPWQMAVLRRDKDSATTFYLTII